MKFSVTLITTLLFIGSSCGQQTRPNDAPITTNTEYSYETVVPDLVNPWGLAILPDGSMLITEKSGELIHFKGGKKELVQNVPAVVTRNQGGLLDIKLHPEYRQNGWIYLTYSSPEGEESGAMTALMRAKLKGNSLVDKEVLYKGSPNTRKGHHFGSRIAFDSTNKVYFSIGDRGARDENPQDITRDGGKIYRLNDDGSIPKDNPFVGTPNAKEAIYSYGHRNPQGMDVHPTTGKIWVHEHGPQGGDEINLIQAKANYGWPVISYGINYDGTSFTEKTKMEGMEQPFYYWVPSIAPSGMAFVHDSKYPELNGNILAGSLKFQYLEHLVIDDEQVVRREKILEDVGRLRNVVMADDGFVYVGVEGKGILKLIKK